MMTLRPTCHRSTFTHGVALALALATLPGCFEGGGHGHVSTPDLALVPTGGDGSPSFRVASGSVVTLDAQCADCAGPLLQSLDARTGAAEVVEILEVGENRVRIGARAPGEATVVSDARYMLDNHALVGRQRIVVEAVDHFEPRIGVWDPAVRSWDRTFGGPDAPGAELPRFWEGGLAMLTGSSVQIEATPVAADGAALVGRELLAWSAELGGTVAYTSSSTLERVNVVAPDDPGPIIVRPGYLEPIVLDAVSPDAIDHLELVVVVDGEALIASDGDTVVLPAAGDVLLHLALRADDGRFVAGEGADLATLRRDAALDERLTIRGRATNIFDSPPEGIVEGATGANERGFLVRAGSGEAAVGVLEFGWRDLTMQVTFEVPAAE